MKQALLLIIMLCSVALLQISCGGSGGTKVAMSNLEKMIVKAEKQDNISFDDWQKMNAEMEKEFEVLNTALDAEQLSAMEKLKLIGLTGRWTVLTGKLGIEKLEEESGMTIEQIGDEMEKAITESDSIVSESGIVTDAEELNNALKQLSDILQSNQQH